MAMSVGGGQEEGAMMAEINTTPLVDVMLVLLIIFLITVPVITRTIRLARASKVTSRFEGERETSFTPRGNSIRVRSTS